MISKLEIMKEFVDDSNNIEHQALIKTIFSRTDDDFILTRDMKHGSIN